MRIDRANGFAPASQPLARPGVRPSLASPRRTSLAQAVVIESEAAREVKGYLDEAMAQLAAINRNYSGLIVSLGTVDAALARAQATAAIATYQAQYNQLVGARR